MFHLFRSKKQECSIDGMRVHSLTEYFDDTVKKIARSNLYDMTMNPGYVKKEMTVPDHVATCLITAGQLISSRSAANSKSQFALSVEEGILASCDMGREAYGIKTFPVLYRPGEMKEILGFDLKA